MKSILCTIYKGKREDELYLYVERGSDLESLPDGLLARLGELKEVMTIKLDSKRKLARVKAADVLHEIETKGFFLQLPPNIDTPVFTYGG